jgi:transposase
VLTISPDLGMYHVPGEVGVTRAEQRQQTVEKLRLEGLSTRGIAEEVGVSHVTVIRDLRAIEQRIGEALPVPAIGGMDGKWYAPKVTIQEYEGEPGFGEGVEEEILASADHLTNALADLQRAEDALQAEGVRSTEVPVVLAEIRQMAAQVLRTNKALPRPPKEEP